MMRPTGFPLGHRRLSIRQVRRGGSRKVKSDFREYARIVLDLSLRLQQTEDGGFSSCLTRLDELQRAILLRAFQTLLHKELLAQS